MVVRDARHYQVYATFHLTAYNCELFSLGIFFCPCRRDMLQGLTRSCRRVRRQMRSHVQWQRCNPVSSPSLVTVFYLCLGCNTTAPTTAWNPLVVSDIVVRDAGH